MGTKKVVIGTLAGLAIGAIAGVLFAPEKGSTTRKQIMDKSDDCVNILKSKFDEFSNSLTEKFERSIEDVEDLVDKGKEEFEDVKNEVKNTAANLQHDIAADLKQNGRRY